MILSLDISSTKTGVCVLDENCNLKLFKYILTKTTTKKEKEKFKDIYDKIAFILEELKKIKENFPDIKQIHIEEPLSKFAQGKSQMSTIKVLFEVNYAISYYLFDLFNIKPIHWNPTRARSVAGIKIKKGDDSKQIVFDYIKNKYDEFNKICGDYKKDNPMVDVADSIVIAIAAASSGGVNSLNESKRKNNNKSNTRNGRKNKG